MQKEDLNIKDWKEGFHGIRNDGIMCLIVYRFVKEEQLWLGNPTVPVFG